MFEMMTFFCETNADREHGNPSRVGKHVASCECGYSVNKTSDPEHAVFTELLESDFLKYRKYGGDMGGDWVPQVWNLDPQRALGPYGRATTTETIIPNWAVDIETNATGINGGLAGLYLVVGSKPITMKDGHQYVAGAELDSRRTDMFYGTFRIGYRMTGVPGTCFGFYWYHNDQQEIDIELLSRQVNTTDSLINLVLHTPVGGSNEEALPGTYSVINLPYDVSSDTHEFRFDWTPTAITWYSDGKQIWTISNATLFPREPGHLVITHWSNGNNLWSGGPPTSNALLVLTYVKAYFNSSEPQRQRDHIARCEAVGAAEDRICEIPSPIGPPRYFGNPRPPLPYFFKEDVERNATYDQIVYPDLAGRMLEIERAIWLIVMAYAVSITTMGFLGI
ncbi:Beta-glucanase [Dactylella cylindrospora]|nr:Beta-glucanase [Dactylella cylindrospora]